MDLWQQIARRAERMSKDLAAQRARECGRLPTYYVPPEILAIIIEKHRTYTSDINSVFDEKVRTLWAVSLANKDCAAIAIPLLWENVKIDMASLPQATYFLRALILSNTSRPFIKNVLLHVVHSQLGNWYTRPIIHLPDRQQCFDRLMIAMAPYWLNVLQEDTLKRLLQERLDNKDNHSLSNRIDLHLDLDVTLVLLLCHNLRNLQVKVDQAFPGTMHARAIGYLTISNSLLARLNAVKNNLPQHESSRHFSIVSASPQAPEPWETTTDLAYSPYNTRAIKSVTLETVAFTHMGSHMSALGTHVHFLTLREVVRDGADFEVAIVEHILTVCRTLYSLDISFSPGCKTLGSRHTVRLNRTRDYSTSLQHLAIHDWHDQMSRQDDYAITLNGLARLTSLKTLKLPLRMLIGRSRSVATQALASALPSSIESLDIYQYEAKSPHLSTLYTAIHFLISSKEAVTKLKDATFMMRAKKHSRSWWLSAQPLPDWHVGICNTHANITENRRRESALKIQVEHTVTDASRLIWHL